MAAYGISQKGMESMNQLAQDLLDINSNIEECGQALKQKVAGLGEGLGTYEEEINQLVAEVNKVQEEGSEFIINLSNKAKDLANQIAELLAAGL